MDKNNAKTCDLFFSGVTTKTNKGKQILHNLSGRFNQGSLVAILGTSGSGKTTLINTLSGYNTQDSTFERLEINGTPSDFNSLSEISCYLTQDIHLNDLLTVEENMWFAAHFKLGASHSQIDKLSLIQEILHSFGLSSAKTTRTSNLSSGERKRLALALEIISDPQIIFLDEPTTGLDISATAQILNYLKKVTKQGKTVICSIHQVCASHFELFNQAYVISDGQCAYQGPPQYLVSFLDNLGLPCDIYHNPADYIIELCSGDYGNDKSGYLIQATENAQKIPNGISNSKYLSADFKHTSTYPKVAWAYQFKALWRREYTKLCRNLLLLPLRIFGSNLIALSIGLLFWNIGNDASKVFINYNFSTAIVANVLLTGLLYPILSFSTQTELIKREVYNKYYTIFQYYIIVILMDIPLSLIANSTSSLLAWYLTGQPIEMDRILVYLQFMLSFGLTINMVGFFFGTLNIPFQSAIVTCICTQLPLMSVSGYGVLFPDVHWFFEYIGRITYIRNALQGCLVSMLGLYPRRINCPEEEEFCFYAEPHRLLIDLGIDPFHYAICWYNIVFWMGVISCFSYIAMKYRLSC